MAEFSSSEFISRLARGGCPFVALPVFPSRVFRHGYIYVNRKSDIRKPQDLAGKRVGVPLYTMTAAVWIRGHLVHQYGVDLSTIRWVEGAINESPAGTAIQARLRCSSPPASSTTRRAARSATS